MNVFITGVWVLVALCAVLFLYTWKNVTTSSSNPNFRAFQRTYLVVYLLAMSADWLQGPHVYALYQSYGKTKSDIEILFVAGFGSSMLFGTIIGSYADRYGRRTNCIMYGVLYILTCITKHFSDFWVLMIGRLLGGIATSILYSAFESWLVYEHHKRGFESDLLGTVFSHAVLGNSIVAIIAGFVAQYFADMFGFVAPFDVSMSVLVVLIVMLVLTWTENYGDVSSDTAKSFKDAFHVIKTDPVVLCLGLIQSLFEGAMYTFVLEWTPALTPAKPAEVQASRTLLEVTEDGHRGSIPHGHIFAGFMIAIMIGSSLFKILSSVSKVESFMRPVLFISALSLLTPILFPGNQAIIFTGFLIFETCVGVFWPAMGTMRGQYVPEEVRATVMNFFRVPLNLIVVLILLQNLEMVTIFKCCVAFLLLATLSQQVLHRFALNRNKPMALPTTEPEKTRGNSTMSGAGNDEVKSLQEA